MQKNFLENVEKIKKSFEPLSQTERYSKLIEMGAKLPPFPNEKKLIENRVEGCQSTLYLTTRIDNENIFFAAFSDSLITAGLAALLIEIYQGFSPKILFTSPPHFLQEIGILNSLSPNRSNGLAQIYIKMKSDVIRLF